MTDFMLLSLLQAANSPATLVVSASDLVQLSSADARPHLDLCCATTTNALSMGETVSAHLRRFRADSGWLLLAALVSDMTRTLIASCTSA